MKLVKWSAGLSLALLASGTAFADSISPTSFGATLEVGQTATITKTVTVSAGAPVSSKVDVFFLADETGSMGGAIGNVKSAAASILSATTALGDVQYGVGGYRDAGDAFVYRELTDLTATDATVQTAINAWAASGGGDYPEAAMFALNSAADNTSWRAGSERLVVWFGDAPADDVDVGGVTQASLIANLNSKGISVLAINVGTIDAFAPTGVGFRGLNDKGQASAIASGTGGTFYDGIATGAVATTIADAIATAVSTYSTVGLDISEVPAGVSVTYAPAGGYSGSFDRSIDRSFTFDLSFTGVTPGTYDFSIYGTVDGGRVATELDSIVVIDRGTTTVPEPGSLFLLGMGIMGLAGARRLRARR